MRHGTIVQSVDGDET